MAAWLPNRDEHEGLYTMQGLHTSHQLTALSAGSVFRNTWGNSRPDVKGPSIKRPGGKRLTAGLVAGLLALGGSALGARPNPLATKGDFALAHVKLGAGRSTAIVTLDGALTPAHRAKIVALGGVITKEFSFIHAVALQLPEQNLGKLAALPFVRHIAQDGAVKKCDAFTVNSSLDNVAFQQYGLTGSGVTVAVLDSGIHMQAQDLQAPPTNLIAGILSLLPLPKGSRVIDGVNFVPNTKGNVTSNAFDDTCGHGTHVSGIIAGDGAASTGLQNTQTFYGVAPLSNLVAVRVLDQNGAGTISTVLAGIQWVIQNKAKDKIRVMNLSLGHPVTDYSANDPLCQAVEAAWKAGIVVVCAAGNDGRLNGAVNTPGLDNEGWGSNYGSIQSPADDPYVITVGAMKQSINAEGSTDTNRNDDKIATYSGRGPTLGDNTLKPDIVAPGNQVISLDVNNSTLDLEDGGTNQIPLSYYQYTLGTKQQSQTSDFYFRLSGTSMSSPVVAAAAALMLQKYPTLSPDTIKARLMVSADKWTHPDGTADACTYGAGYLDISAALSSTVTVPSGTYATSPLLVTDSTGDVSIAMDPSVYGSRALWGCNGIWGAGITDLRALWGCNAVMGSGALDASRALWGCSTLTDSRALWGCNALWGSDALSESRALWGCSFAGVDLSNTAIDGE
jgi:serine protease AprX